MGIQGVLGGSRLVRPFFQPERRDVLLLKLGKGIVLVDVSGIIHAGLANHAHNILRGDWEAFDQEMAARLNQWKHSTPSDTCVIFYFDGFRCTAKKANEARKEERADALSTVVELTDLIEDVRLEAEAERLVLSGSIAAGDSDSPGGDAAAKAASFEDARKERIRALCKHKKDLAKAEGVAASARAKEAAYRVMRLCKDRSLQFVVSAGEAEHSMAARCAWDLEVVAVCGYDSDFFVLAACPAVLYGQGLQGVMNLLSWKAVADNLERARVVFDEHLQPNSTARMSTAQQGHMSTAMHTYGAQVFVQLTALLSNNDYTRYEQVGLAKYAAAWAVMCAKSLDATLLNYATCIAEAMPPGKQTLEERIADYVHRAERAAFMYFGQPVIVGTTLHLPELPAFVGGCTATLFKAAPPHGTYAAGVTPPYLLQDEADSDLLQLFSFFAEMLPDDRVRWAEGGVDVSSSNPVQLIDAPEVELSTGYSIRSKRPEDMVNALSFTKLKAMAKRFAVPYTGVNEKGLRDMIRGVVNLHYRVMAGDEMEERADSQGTDHTNMVNKAKDTVSKELRAAVASGTWVDVTSASDLRDYFNCPLPVLNTWTLLVDEMPGVINQRRVSEARTRTVVIEKFVVQTADPDRGYVLMHVKKSLGAWHDVVLEVALAPAPPAPAVGQRNVYDKRDIKSIERAVCLLPEGAVEADGAVKKDAKGNIAASVKKTRYCYGGEFCIHVAAATRYLHVATAQSTTDDAAWWMKRSPLVKDESTATDTAFATVLNGVTGEATAGGTPMSLRSFNPVPELDRMAIKLGIDPVHGDELYYLLYLEYRKLVLAASGKDALRTDVLTHIDEVEGATLHPPARGIGSKGVPPDGPAETQTAAAAASDGDAASSHSSGVVVITAAQVAARNAHAVVPMMVEQDDADAAAGTDDEAELAAAAAVAMEEEADASQEESSPSGALEAQHTGGAVHAAKRVMTRTQAAEAVADAAKRAKKSKRRCSCPLGKACTVNSPNERHSALPRFKSFIMKGKSNEDKAHVREILERLKVEGDALVQAMARTQIDINPGHFVEEAFWRSDRGWMLAYSAAEIPLMRVTAVQLDEAKLAASHEVFMGYRDNCICGDPDCTRELNKRNSVALVRQRPRKGHASPIDTKELSACGWAKLPST